MSAAGVGVRVRLLMVLFLVLLATPPSPARGQAFCEEGQTLAPGTAYLALQPLLSQM
jgi:hypothetical protein